MPETIKRYQYRTEEGRGPGPHGPRPTDDMDKARLEAATFGEGYDIWDTEREAFVTPIRSDAEFNDVLKRYHSKNRVRRAVRCNFWSVLLTAVALGVLAYSAYQLIGTAEPL